MSAWARWEPSPKAGASPDLAESQFATDPTESGGHAAISGRDAGASLLVTSATVRGIARLRSGQDNLTDHGIRLCPCVETCLDSGETDESAGVVDDVEQRPGVAVASAEARGSAAVRPLHLMLPTRAASVFSGEKFGPSFFCRRIRRWTYRRTLTISDRLTSWSEPSIGAMST